MIWVPGKSGPSRPDRRGWAGGGGRRRPRPSVRQPTCHRSDRPHRSPRGGRPGRGARPVSGVRHQFNVGLARGTSWWRAQLISPVLSAVQGWLSSLPLTTGSTRTPRTAGRRLGGTSARAAWPSSRARSSATPSSCPWSAWRCPPIWVGRTLSANPRGWIPLLSRENHHGDREEK